MVIAYCQWLEVSAVLAVDPFDHAVMGEAGCVVAVTWRPLLTARVKPPVMLYCSPVIAWVDVWVVDVFVA